MGGVFDFVGGVALLIFLSVHLVQILALSIVVICI